MADTENINKLDKKPDQDLLKQNNDEETLIVKPNEKNNEYNTNLDEEEDDDNLGPPIPPDGGYGWVICFMSFLTNVIVDGVCFSVGIFMIEFLQHYDVSKAKMSWVGSVLNGMYLSVGPIVGALCNRFGCRSVCIVGSIFAAFSYVIASFSPNVDVLILTYGAMGGFGFGLMYLPAIVMVGFYFERRRAFATGIAVCGSGIGAFVFAPLCHYLLDEYSWKGATWILGGIALHGVLIGALFRPLKASRKSKDKKNIYVAPTTNNEDNTVQYKNDRTLSEGDNKPHIGVLNKRLASLQNETDDNSKSSCIHSMHNLSPSGVFSGGDQSGSITKSVDNLLLVNTTHSSKPVNKRLADLSKPMYRKDIFYSGSIQNLPEFQKSPDIETYVRNITEVPDEEIDKCVGKSKKGSGNKAFSTVLRLLSGFALLKNPVFFIYGISCFLCMTGFFVPFIFLPDHAIGMGLTGQQGAFLISIIGIANTVARVLCGFVSDLKWVDCLLLNNIALIIAGVATILCPLCFNYALLATYSVVFGSGIAVFVSLRSIVVVELLGLDQLTNAFGLVTMFQGFSAFIGAPIAGALYDATGNYNYSFYMAGSTLAMSGIINLPLRRIAAYLERKHEQENNRSECVPISNGKV